MVNKVRSKISRYNSFEYNVIIILHFNVIDLFEEMKRITLENVYTCVLVNC